MTHFKLSIAAGDRISAMSVVAQADLTSFLAKVCPLMEEQLEETVDNRLFDGNATDVDVLST